MEEIIPLIFHGCQLARDLESNLPNLATQPNILSKSCDEIVKIFINARERLNANQDLASYHPHVFFGELQGVQQSEIDVGVQEWLRSSYTQAMDEAGKRQLEVGRFDGRREEMGMEVSGRDMEGSGRDSGGELQSAVASDPGRVSSVQRSRRRNDEAGKRTLIVPAPRMGNIDIPPEDNYTWRKYGQKEILGAKFPRSYYRCTHQKLYNCPAKKQAQRLDNDPYTFEITYRGSHTCHMPITAPSSSSIEIPRSQNTTTQPAAAPFTSASSLPLSAWLSMDVKPTSSGSEVMDSFIDSHVQMYKNLTGGISMVSGGGSGGGSGGAGPSNVRYGKEVDYQPVVDMADVMFNSGSSSNNSMDLIFNSMEDKWEPSDKKDN